MIDLMKIVPSCAGKLNLVIGPKSSGKTALLSMLVLSALSRGQKGVCWMSPHFQQDRKFLKNALMDDEEKILNLAMVECQSFDEAYHTIVKDEVSMVVMDDIRECFGSLETPSSLLAGLLLQKGRTVFLSVLVKDGWGHDRFNYQEMSPTIMKSPIKSKRLMTLAHNAFVVSMDSDALKIKLVKCRDSLVGKEWAMDKGILDDFLKKGLR